MTEVQENLLHFLKNYLWSLCFLKLHQNVGIVWVNSPWRIYLSIFLSVHPTIHPSIYPSILWQHLFQATLPYVFANNLERQEFHWASPQILHQSWMIKRIGLLEKDRKHTVLLWLKFSLSESLSCDQIYTHWHPAKSTWITPLGWWRQGKLLAPEACAAHCAARSLSLTQESCICLCLLKMLS